MMLILSRKVVVAAVTGCFAVFSGMVGAEDNMANPFAFTNEDGQKVVVYGDAPCPGVDLDEDPALDQQLQEVEKYTPSDFDTATSCFASAGEEVEIKMMRENPDYSGVWLISENTMSRDELQSLKSATP